MVSKRGDGAPLRYRGRTGVRAMTISPDDSALQPEQVELLRRLRVPRGKYSASRAAQLSGIPERTIYHWASAGSGPLLRPDWDHVAPKRWSYRDLVYLRLTAWLRSKRMPAAEVRARVGDVREALSRGDERYSLVRSDGKGLFVGDDDVDSRTGQSALTGLLRYFDEFNLVEAAAEIADTDRPLWGPNLVRPSARTSISPWVMGGDPCVRDTRVPTSTLYALHGERRLPTDRIALLYPGLTESDINDALTLEARLQNLAPGV